MAAGQFTLARQSALFSASWSHRWGNLLTILTITIVLFLADITNFVASQQQVFPAAEAAAATSRDTNLRWQNSNINNNNNNNNNNNINYNNRQNTNSEHQINNHQYEQVNTQPVVINKQTEITVGVGSNISLPCTARGSAPLTFVWFQDERNLTTSGKPANNNAGQAEFPSSTKLLEEKRYEIAEELGPPSQPNVTTSKLYLFNLKITDSSLFLCWVENPAGYTIANFSLIVTDSLPQQSLDINHNNDQTNHQPNNYSSPLTRWLASTGRTFDARLGLISIGFVMLLVAAIILLLLLFKHNNPNDCSSKSSQSSDLKSNHHLNDKGGLGGKITPSSRFSPHQMNYHHVSDSSAEDEQDDGEADDGEASDSSACRKNPKLMAASDLDGFIEHMRSGIINMDYHSMSPVIQFNKNLKQQQQQSKLHQNGQQVSYMDTISNNNYAQGMHHFASGSGASSIPYYGGPTNGSASMATTTSDLSPGSGSGNAINTIQFANQNGPITNCDLPLNDMAPATNTTTTSYTSDYQSGYSEDPVATMIPPSMYYTDTAIPVTMNHHLNSQHHQMYHHQYGPSGASNQNSLFNQTNQLMMAPSTLRPVSVASQQHRGSLILQHNNGVNNMTSIVGSANNLHQNNRLMAANSQRFQQRMDEDLHQVL